MHFLLDEGLPYRRAAFLIALGHDVTAVGQDYPYSLTDYTILEIACTERRTILTNDKDFGDLVVRDHVDHAGVILFRLGYVSIEERTAMLQRVLDEYTGDLDQFSVVTRTTIRVHRE